MAEANRAVTGKPVGETFVSRYWVVLMIATVLILSALCLHALWAFWPTTPGEEAAALSQDVRFLGANLTVRSEVLIFIVVAVAGALGGLIHTVRSLSWYVGNRFLKWSWVPFYLMLPVVGALLATVFYVVLRGGLFSGQTATDDVNAYGFVALAALTGMFSEQATEKLKTVFAALFTDTEAGKDHVDAGPPAIASTAAADVTAETATLTGMLDPRGRETTYWFEYGPTGQRTEEQTTSGAGEQSVRAEIAGLTAGTEYRFQLVARSTAGESRGTQTAFTTLDS